jgi:hypothetical protein
MMTGEFNFFPAVSWGNDDDEGNRNEIRMINRLKPYHVMSGEDKLYAGRGSRRMKLMWEVKWGCENDEQMQEIG